MAVMLDTAEKTQVNTAPGSPRSIYDASKKEIMLRSFLAGLSLGLGHAVASFLFFAIILGLLVTYLQPVIESAFPQLNQFNTLLEQATQTLSTPSSTPSTTVGE